MLTTILTILITALTLLLFVSRSTFGRHARRETVYICDICNTQDCLCRKKR